jgi:hypothetical protein
VVLRPLGKPTLSDGTETLYSFASTLMHPLSFQLESARQYVLEACVSHEKSNLQSLSGIYSMLIGRRFQALFFQLTNVITRLARHRRRRRQLGFGAGDTADQVILKQ